MEIKFKPFVGWVFRPSDMEWKIAIDFHPNNWYKFVVFDFRRYPKSYFELVLVGIAGVETIGEKDPHNTKNKAGSNAFGKWQITPAFFEDEVRFMRADKTITKDQKMVFGNPEDMTAVALHAVERFFNFYSKLDRDGEPVSAEDVASLIAKRWYGGRGAMSSGWDIIPNEDQNNLTYQQYAEKVIHRMKIVSGSNKIYYYENNSSAVNYEFVESRLSLVRKSWRIVRSIRFEARQAPPKTIKWIPGIKNFYSNPDIVFVKDYQKWKKSPWGFISPVSDGSYVITQSYKSRHRAHDLRARPYGSKKLVVPYDGKVVKCERWYGNKDGRKKGDGLFFIVIDHGIIQGEKVRTVCIHLPEVYVSLGEKVAQGQIIAKIGGQVKSQPHLHYQLMVVNSKGKFEATNPKGKVQPF